MKFNEKLIALRKKEGLSQEELGYKLNVTRQTVSKWELGQTTPEMDKLSEMSKIFNISVDQLINESEITNDSEINPINNKIEDQPIQEKGGKNNKIIFILIIVFAIILVYIIAKAFLGFLGLSIFNKAAEEITGLQGGVFDKVFGTATNIIDTTMNQIEDKSNIEDVHSKAEEIFDTATNVIGGTINGMENNSNTEDVQTKAEEIIGTATNIIESTKNEIKNNSSTQNTSNKNNNVSNEENKTVVPDDSNINTNIPANKEYDEAVKEAERNIFNGQIEIFAGTSKKLFATSVLDKIITSNKANDRKITVKYNKTETQDESKIRSIKQTINEADAFQDFEIICKYDAEGYISKVIIEKV